MRRQLTWNIPYFLKKKKKKKKEKEKKIMLSADVNDTLIVA